jgi:1-acyl-sn-glycerol-3-phosphate acyltransferase
MVASESCGRPQPRYLVRYFVVNAVRSARFVAKSEIRDWPVIGWLCEKVGTIFVMRVRPSATVKINEVIHDVLAAGDCVGLFPEGVTSAGNMLRKFHSSLFEPTVANRATFVIHRIARYEHLAADHHR